MKFSFIPNKVKILPDWCFGICPNITINQFGGADSLLEKIGTNVFYNAGSPSVTTLTFAAPLSTMNAKSLFVSSAEDNYGSSVTTIYTHSLFGYDTEDEWEMALFGWTNNSASSRVNEITTHLTV